MLFAIWQAVGIIVGLMVLIPLLIFAMALVYGCMKELINLVFALVDVIQTLIDEKIHKK